MAPGKPESALAKAHDLVNVNKQSTAIEVLSECMKAQKKQKAWNKTLEEVMMLLASLCVESKKTLQFKEVIHQYKNVTMQLNPRSLEDVVKYYLNEARKRTEEARDKSQQLMPDIEDLDNPETPESLMLTVVNAEGEQERQDKAILTPWLKFLWESYRQCMELLRNNTKFERLYHDIVQEASEFCRKFDRKTEFKKLSDILRLHMSKLQSAAATSSTPQSTSESWALHLETRLKQLDHSLKFELYNEAFKAVEDICNLLSTSNITAKPRILANYYTKTATVFFQSGTSYLFHAAALHKLFFFSRENKRNINPEELKHMASHMIIATLSVPLPNNREPVDPLLESGEISNPTKLKALSMLLNLPNPPSRASLIKDIYNNRVHELVSTELSNLFKVLEFEYKPLSMVKDVLPVLEWLKNHPDFRDYVDLIQEIVVSKTLLQIGKVFKTIKLIEMEKLCPFVSSLKLQTIVINLIRNLELPVRLDHRQGVLKFDVYTDLGISQRHDDDLVSEEINGISSLSRQLSKFSTAIFEVAEFIGHIDSSKLENREWVRQSYLRKIDESHQNVLNRKNLIETRKEEIEKMEEENQKKMSDQIRQQEERRRKEETNRLKDMKDQMEKKKMEEEKEMHKSKMKKARVKYLMSSVAGHEVLKNYTEKELEDMDEIKLVKIQHEEKNRMKEEEDERMRKLEQKVDYFQRALRLEEIPRIKEVQVENYEAAKRLFDENEEIRKKESRDLHHLKLRNKDLCILVKNDIEKYISEISVHTDVQYKLALKDWEEECEKIKWSYCDKRRPELIEEKRRADAAAEVLAREAEKKKQEAAVQQPKTYIPPHMRDKDATRAPFSDQNRTVPSNTSAGGRNIARGGRQNYNFNAKTRTDTESDWRTVTKK